MSHFSRREIDPNIQGDTSKEYAGFFFKYSIMYVNKY